MSIINNIKPLMDYYDQFGYSALVDKLTYEYTENDLSQLAQRMNMSGESDIIEVADRIAEFAKDRKIRYN